MYWCSLLYFNIHLGSDVSLYILAVTIKQSTHVTKGKMRKLGWLKCGSINLYKEALSTIKANV